MIEPILHSFAPCVDLTSRIGLGEQRNQSAWLSRPAENSPVQILSGELDAHNIKPLKTDDLVFPPFSIQRKPTEKQLMSTAFNQDQVVAPSQRPILSGGARLWWQFWCAVRSS
jgi:hypothetical protein